MADQGEIIDYLLGELDELDRVRFERSLQDDPSLRAEVDRMRPVLGRLDALGDEAWEHVAGRSAEETIPARAARPARRRLRPRRAVLGWRSPGLPRWPRSWSS